MTREIAKQGMARSLGAPAVITFPVELDVSNSACAQNWLIEALEEHPAVVIADMTLTEFCDTTGIRSLIVAHKRMAEEGTELRIVVPSPHIRRVMSILGIEKVLDLYTDLAAAQSGPPAS